MRVQYGVTWQQRLDNAVQWSLYHWLLIANGLALLYAGLPWVSPLAHIAGWDRLGLLIMLMYRPLCHQLPQRSFCIHGYQVAYCHRCVALYTSMVVAGLLFSAIRRVLKPLPMWVCGLLLLPMLLDGGSHVLDDVFQIGFRSGGDAPGTWNFALRMLTGVLVGIAALLTIYPRLERDLHVSQVEVTTL